MSLYAISYDVKDLLVTNGYTFGGNNDWSLHLNAEPCDLDNVFTIYDLPGSVVFSLPHPTTEKPLNKGSFQVRCKSLNHNEGFQELTSLAETLDANTQWTATASDPDTDYVCVTRDSDVHYIGRDDAKNYIFTCEYTANRHQKES